MSDSESIELDNDIEYEESSCFESSEEHLEFSHLFTGKLKARGIDSDSEDKLPIKKLSSLKIKLDNRKSTEFLDTNTIINLSSIDFYNKLIKSPMIIFISDLRMMYLDKLHRIGCNPFSKKIKYDFPGCTFVSFNAKEKIVDYLDELNKKVLENELDRVNFIDDNNETPYSIYFEDSEIIKDCVYKKLIIKNKILFVPIDKYQLKLTEYKIRGFCQIMEELGAKSIEISFNNTEEKNNIKDLKAHTNVSTIAGNLGFSLKDKKKKEEAIKYGLDYPDTNTIILNEKMIRDKIRLKRYIISEDNYNSNLELQYVISSRCRHFITKYSTSFTLDNSISIDKTLETNFKKNDISLGSSYSTSNNNKSHISIITDVVFSSEENMIDNLAASCVSYDSLGFKYLINSLSDGNFDSIGIYKIMEYINLYTKHYLKKKKPKTFKVVQHSLTKIKRLFSIEEYAQLLKGYFSNVSQWIQFENFINLLAQKSISYDKLGYLIITEKENTSYIKKMDLIIDLIQYLCDKRGIQDKFWEMLQPRSKRFQYYLEKMLLEDYNIVHTYNWFNLQKLLNEINKYILVEDEIPKKTKESRNNTEEYKLEITFDCLYNNLLIGYPYWEFYRNMMPFIRRLCHRLYYLEVTKSCDDEICIIKKDRNYINPLLIKAINYESFIMNRINTYDKLINYIRTKVIKLELGIKLTKYLQSIMDSIKLTENWKEDKKNLLLQTLESDDFEKRFSYFNKKLSVMTKKELNKEKQNFIITSLFFNLFETEDTINIRLGNYIDNMLIYNDKILVDKVPLNNFGYSVIVSRAKIGCEFIEGKYLLVPYIRRWLVKIGKIIFRNDTENYDKFIVINYNIKKQYTIFIKSIIGSGTLGGFLWLIINYSSTKNKVDISPETINKTIKSLIEL